MQTHRYTAAVVGAGRGGNLSLKALAASQRFSLEAVADVRPDALAAAQSQFPGIRTFTSHEAMLQDCPTDVVCVSTYPPTHRPIAMDALEAGVRGLLVEKPLGDSAAAGRQIIDAARQRSVPLAVPHGLLVADHSVEILRRVQDGQIGQVRLMEVQSPKWDIINAGIHWLNFFVALTDNEPVATVQAAADTSGRTCRDGMQVETEAVTYVVTRSGIRFVMHRIAASSSSGPGSRLTGYSTPSSPKAGCLRSHRARRPGTSGTWRPWPIRWTPLRRTTPLPRAHRWHWSWSRRRTFQPGADAA